MTTRISDLRKEYSKAGLRRADLHPDPVAQFRVWLNLAIEKEMPEPNAMTLATVDSMGLPDARILLLKGIDERGFHFYTNQESAKAAELSAHPTAALVFLWVEMERQVRVRGSVTKLSRADTETYFASRPRGSQLGAWVSRQSSTIPDRAAMECRLAELEAMYPQKIPVPPFWGGYTVKPVSLEFWQGRPNRLHDRFLYSAQADGQWKIDRLAP
jgi:pyridoxamine 5'-phosphate oxidase